MGFPRMLDKDRLRAVGIAERNREETCLRINDGDRDRDDRAGEAG